MTSYLQPIDEEEPTCTVEVRHFNPETDPEPHWESHTVPLVRSMTVIQALEYLWDQNQYIAFRSNCREMTCGSCAMRINGRPGLACMTLLEPDTQIAPLEQYPVLRDLIVDASSIEQKYRELALWPQGAADQKIASVSPKVMDSYGQVYSRCIECYACLDACPESDAMNTQFDGPMFMLQIARVGSHPLDSQDRTRQALDRGALSCVNCYECADVCPVDLNPAAEVAKLRGSGVLRSLSRFFGERVASWFGD